MTGCGTPDTVHDARPYGSGHRRPSTHRAPGAPDHPGHFQAPHTCCPQRQVPVPAPKHKRIAKSAEAPTRRMRIEHPERARQRRSAEAEVAKVASISMSAPLQMPWKYLGNSCTQGGRGQGAQYALLASHPLARHTTHSTCWASDCTRASVQARTAASGQCKSSRRVAQNDPFMSPGLQTARDRHRIAVGVSGAVWHTKFLEGSLQRQSAKCKGGLGDGSSGSG